MAFKTYFPAETQLSEAAQNDPNIIDVTNCPDEPVTFTDAQKHARSWVDKTESMKTNSELIKTTQKLVVDAIREKLEHLNKFGDLDLDTPEETDAYRSAIRDVQNYLNEL